MNYPTETFPVFIYPFSLKGRWKCGMSSRWSSLRRLGLVLTKFLDNLVEIELDFALKKSVSPVTCESWLDIVDRVYEITGCSVPVRIRESESSAVVVRFLPILKPRLYWSVSWWRYFQLLVSLYNLSLTCFVCGTESFLQLDQHVIYG